MTWDELFDKFTQSRRLAAETLRGYRWNIQSFLDFSEVPTPLEVTSAHLSAFFASQKRTVSAATAGARLRTLLVLFRWAVRQELLAFDPGHDLKIPKPRRPIPRILTRLEVDSLLAAPWENPQEFMAARDAAILEVLYGNGLRAGELVALDLDKVDLADQSLAVIGGKGKPRRTPFGDSVARALLIYLDHRPERAQALEKAFFVSRYGYRMTAKHIADLVARYAKPLGLVGASAHGLRRALATHLLENGANLAEVKAMLGHADIASTQFYAQILPTEMFRSYHKTHPRARRGF
jgi:integrase/recombinase XerC